MNSPQLSEKELQAIAKMAMETIADLAEAYATTASAMSGPEALKAFAAAIRRTNNITWPANAAH